MKAVIHALIEIGLVDFMVFLQRLFIGRPAFINAAIEAGIVQQQRCFNFMGYIALAPDGLSAVGGYPGNDDEGRALQQKVDPVKLMNDFFAAVAFMANYPRG